MDKDEKKYLLRRIDEMVSDKIRVIDDARCAGMNTDEKMELILESKVKMLPFTELRASTDFCDCFDFSEYAPKRVTYEEANKRKKLVHQKATELKDTIMLGNAEGVIGLLNEFKTQVF